MSRSFICFAGLFGAMLYLGCVSPAALSKENATTAGYESIVSNVYAELLNRAPDESGLDFYAGRMAGAGLDERELRAEIRNSREYRERVFCHGAFADNNGNPAIHWPAVYPDSKPPLWTSLATPAATGAFVSAEFTTPPKLFFYISGYPRHPGNRIMLADAATGERIEFCPVKDPGAAWRLVQWRLETNWIGRAVRLTAGDNSARPDKGWLGVSAPLLNYEPPPWYVFMNRPFFTAGLICLHFFLFVLPGLALALFLPPACFQKPGRFLAAVLILACFCGYLAFWIYFANPLCGKIFSAACAGLAVFAAVKERRRLFSPPMRLELVWPLAIVASIGIFVLSFGFLYGGTEKPLRTSTNRFSHALPVDQCLPLWGAIKIYNGRTIVETWRDTWRFSDRPPLQTGIVLLQSPLFMDTEKNDCVDLHYLCLAVPLQCLALAGLWILLRQLKTGRLAAFGVLSFAVLAPVFIVNAFFVWPKLLAVPFLFIVMTELLFRDCCDDRRDNLATGLIIGASSGLAMLAHGGSFFGLAGIAAAALLCRRWPSARIIAAALVPFAVLLLSWTIFQKVYDPPGDALIKMHIGGSLTPWDGRSITATILDSYARLPLGEIAKKKLMNLVTLLARLPFIMPHPAAMDVSSFLAWMRLTLFFHLIPSLGPLLLVLPALLLAAARRVPRTSLSAGGFKCLLAGAATTAAWCLIMFADTFIHQGTLFTPLVFSAGLALLAFWFSRPFGIALLVMQIVLSAAVYAPLYIHPSSPQIWLRDIDPGMLVMALLSLAAYLALLRKYQPCA